MVQEREFLEHYNADPILQSSEEEIMAQRFGEYAQGDFQKLIQLQTELSKRVSNARLNFEGQPYPVSIRPHILSAQSARSLATVGERFVSLFDTAADLYFCDEEVRRLFPGYESVSELIRISPSLRPFVRICRLDGIVDEDGRFLVLETNTEGPGGVIQNGMAGAIWSSLENPLTEGLSISALEQPYVRDRSEFQKELISSHEQRTGRRPEYVGVVNYKHRFSNEVHWMLDGLSDLGIAAKKLEASDLRVVGGRLVDCDGVPIDLVYNKLDVRDLLNEPAVSSYLSAIANGLVTSVNPLVSQWILSDKAILALFSDPRFSHNFSPTDQAFISAHVPWTRLVEHRDSTNADGDQINLPEYIMENRQKLVLKPTNATRGEGVTIGRFSSQEGWSECVRQACRTPHVVQAYVEPSAIRAVDPTTHKCVDMSFGIDLYVFGGHLAGFQARASVDPVMNVGRRGILLPIAIAEDTVQ